MKYNAIFICDTYTQHIHMICINMISSKIQIFLYNNKIQKFYLAFRKRNVRKICTPFGTLARQVEKLARHLACWHAILKHWHAIWHVGTLRQGISTSYGTLARFWHVGAQATLARWGVGHVGAQVRMARGLASVEPITCERKYLFCYKLQSCTKYLRLSLVVM